MENSEKLVKCSEKLSRNGFQTVIVPSAKEAGEYIKNFIEKTAPKDISYGDSMTLYSTGVIEWLRAQKQHTFIDTFEKGVRFKELIERRRQALTAELFMTGTNAVAMDGSLHWLDMIGNRIAPVAFGPKKVIITVGHNKIVETLEDAFNRIREIAAPLNAKRHEDFITPCVKTGVCMDCSSPHRICNARLIMHKCLPKERITVILIDEDLGL